jgi:hypothetical protein
VNSLSSSLMDAVWGIPNPAKLETGRLQRKDRAPPPKSGPYGQITALCCRRRKIAIDPQSLGLALFRMELGREQPPAGDRGDKRGAVVALGQHQAPVLGHAVVAVDEIERFALVRQAFLEGRPPPDESARCSSPCAGTLSAAGSLKRTTRPGKIPSPLTSPSSEPSKSACMPRQTPRNGRSLAIQSATVASSPDERSDRTQSRNAPTPGRTRPPAPHSPASAGVRTTTGDAPTASSAFVTLRRLQMPVSMTATRALIGDGLKAALGARQELRRARLDLGRGVQRLSKGLEDRLRDVVRLLPVDRARRGGSRRARC